MAKAKSGSIDSTSQAACASRLRLPTELVLQLETPDNPQQERYFHGSQYGPDEAPRTSLFSSWQMFPRRLVMEQATILWRKLHSVSLRGTVALGLSKERITWWLRALLSFQRLSRPILKITYSMSGFSQMQ